MKKALILILILAPLLGHAELLTLPNEPDVCSNIEGHQYPAPAGYHAEADGTCTPLQDPVTIDVVPPGGEAQSIDVTPVGGSVQVIDVNPAQTTSGSASGRSDATVSTPKVITSTEELKTYIFDPNTTTEERMVAIQTRLISLLTKLLQQLQEQLNTP